MFNQALVYFMPKNVLKKLLIFTHVELILHICGIFKVYNEKNLLNNVNNISI